MITLPLWMFILAVLLPPMVPPLLFGWVNARQRAHRTIATTARPRVWREGDPEPPADVTLLRVSPRCDGGNYLRRTPNGGWWFVQRAWDEPDPDGWSWTVAFNSVTKITALTEVAGGVAPPSADLDSH